jgi:hypothetical protein
VSTISPRPRWLLPVLIGGAATIAVLLWLFQPWLLFVDEVANDELAVTVLSEPTPEPATEPTPDSTPDPATTDATPDPTTEPEPSEPSGPVVVASGEFISRDHETLGTASIVELEDGTRILQLEGFRTSNGPDLYVYLDDDPADADALAFDDGLDLGALRGNIGDLVYEIPDDADLEGLDTVVIWCDRFSHVFGAADLTAT